MASEEYEEVSEEGEEDVEEDEDEEVFIGDCSRGAGTGAGRHCGFGGRGSYPQATGGESDDEDDERLDRDQQLLQDPCLPVSGAPMPPGDGPPKDADEYLRQVQWERMHCPEVVDVEVVDLPAKKNRRQDRKGGGLLSRIDALAPHDEETPWCCDEWAEDVATSFRALRIRCEAARDDASEGDQAKTTLAAWRQLCASGRPSFQDLARHDFVSLNRLVVVAIEALLQFQEEIKASHLRAVEETAEVPEVHFEEKPVAPELLTKSAPALDLERIDSVTEWVFAALAFVELPLIDDIQFQLQQLRRSCHRFLTLTKAMPSGMGSAGLARANLLLVVVTRVFGQR